MAGYEDNTLAVFANTPERIRAKIMRDGDCWIWTGSRDRDGYGSATTGGTKVKVHRFVYEVEIGPIEAGKLIMHSCDRPSCVNPSHLKMGTQKDNMGDCVKKGRSAAGEKHGASFLTADMVRKIRQRVANGERQSDIASEFGLARPHVCLIVKRRRWSHIA